MQTGPVKRAFIFFPAIAIVLMGLSAVFRVQGVSGFVSKRVAFSLANPGATDATIDDLLSEEAVANLTVSAVVGILALVAFVAFHLASSSPLFNGHRSGVYRGPQTMAAAKTAKVIVLSAGVAVVTERLLSAFDLSGFLVRIPASDGIHAHWASGADVATLRADSNLKPAIIMDWTSNSLALALDLSFAWLFQTALKGSRYCSTSKTSRRLRNMAMFASCMAYGLSYIGFFLAVSHPVIGNAIFFAGGAIGLAYFIIIPIVLYKAVLAEECAADEARVACSEDFNKDSNWVDMTTRIRALAVVLLIVAGMGTFQLAYILSTSVWRGKEARLFSVVIEAVAAWFKGVLGPAAFFVINIMTFSNADAHFQRLVAEDNEKRRIQAQKLIIRYVCHEVRVPLNSLTIGIDLIADALGLSLDTSASAATASAPMIQADGRHVSADDLRQCLDTLQFMTQGTSGMRRILNDVLQIQAIEQGRVALTKDPFDPGQLSKRVLETFAGEAQRAGVELSGTVSLEGVEEGVRVVGDNDRLLQVCSNLVSNALKFTPSGKRVRIKSIVRCVDPLRSRKRFSPTADASLYAKGGDHSSQRYVSFHAPNHREGDDAASVEEDARTSAASSISEAAVVGQAVELEFRVVDEGIGIEPGDIQKLFKPFHQLESGAKFKQNSTGLGLSISRGIVELHGGTISAKSGGTGQGSTFWFCVPVDVYDSSERCPSSAVSVRYGPRAINAGSIALDGPPTRTASAALHGSRLRTSHKIHIAPRQSVTHSLRRSPSLRIGGSAIAHRIPSQVERGLGRAGSPTGTPSLPSIPQKASTDMVPISISEPSPTSSAAGSSYLPLRTCIVVDDIAGNRLLLERLLSRMGLAVHTAANGREGVDTALRVLASLPPSAPPLLVLMDGNMPVLNGVDGTRELMSRAGAGGRVVVVGVTGNAHKEDREAFMEAGAREVAVKPVSRKMLEGLIKRVM